MNGENYRVIFKGEIREGENIEDVKSKLASELNLEIDKIERLFSKGAVIVKKGANLGTCEKIKSVFDRAGAICVIEKEKNVGEKTNGPVPPPIPAEIVTGSAMNARPPVKKADERFCENCGAIVKINSLACHVCGKKFSGKKSMPGCAIAAIVLAVIMFVLAIIGILAAIAIPNFIAYRNKALNVSARTELTIVAAAEDQYYAKHDRYTTDLEDLGYEPGQKNITIAIVSADSECFEAVAELKGRNKELRIDCSKKIWEVGKSPGSR
jgi:competence protein ComGC